MPDAAKLMAKVLPDSPIDDAILDAIALSAGKTEMDDATKRRMFCAAAVVSGI